MYFSISNFYKVRHKNLTKAFRVLSCAIYTIINNYGYIDDLVCQSKKFCVIFMDINYLKILKQTIGYWN